MRIPQRVTELTLYITGKSTNGKPVRGKPMRGISMRVNFIRGIPISGKSMRRNSIRRNLWEKLQQLGHQITFDSWLIIKLYKINLLRVVSDVPILGLRPRTALTEGFWEDQDCTKTDPQWPKDWRSFSVLKLANFLADFRPICSQIWINFWISLFPKCQWWVGPQKWTDF